MLWIIFKETVGDSPDILKAILGHRYHQNHSNRVISSEWSQHLQRKSVWLRLQSVNAWVLSPQYTIDCFADISTREARTSALVNGARSQDSETRNWWTVHDHRTRKLDLDQTWKAHTRTLKTVKDTLFVANLGFIRFVWYDCARQDSETRSRSNVKGAHTHTENSERHTFCCKFGVYPLDLALFEWLCTITGLGN